MKPPFNCPFDKNFRIPSHEDPCPNEECPVDGEGDCDRCSRRFGKYYHNLW